MSGSWKYARRSRHRMVYGAGNNINKLAGPTMRYSHGFTLVELLVSVTLFTMLMGTFFAVVGSVRRAESFQGSTTTLTQSASYAFEPIVRDVKDAEGLELINLGTNQAFCVRGYYVRQRNPSVLQNSTQLTTLAIERQRGASGVESKRLVRRDFDYDPIADRIIETTYTMPPGDAGTSCREVAWSNAIRTSRQLTGNNVAVKTL